MKKLELEQMETLEGGNNWLAFTCGVGIVGLEASFAFPVLFAFTAPLTVSACTAGALRAAVKS